MAGKARSIAYFISKFLLWTREVANLAKQACETASLMTFSRGLGDSGDIRTINKAICLSVRFLKDGRLN